MQDGCVGPPVLLSYVLAFSHEAEGLGRHGFAPAGARHRGSEFVVLMLALHTKSLGPGMLRDT